MAGEKLIKIIKKACSEVLESQKLTDIIYAKVTSQNPLEVEVEGRFPIGENFLVLSPLCREKKVNINGQEVILWENLKVGDKVNLMRFNKGQNFYVIDKGSV